ncbi:MAG: L-threonylcarbamoyladenylate synthase [Syntrophobacteraceae bacterium]
MNSICSRSTIRLWRTDPENPDAATIAQAASVLRNGGVIVYPTETFYGLGAHPMLEAAIKRIYGIKGRDFTKPLPLIASDIEAARRAVAQWPPEAERLARAFWPGPLTMVLTAAKHLPASLHAHTGKIAVRVSSHPIAQALSAAIGGLLISTSANKAGKPALRTPEDLEAIFLADIDGLFHAGTTPGHLPSTIVDLNSTPPGLIRDGSIPWEDVKNTCDLKSN